jgi:hypothetical protein
MWLLALLALALPVLSVPAQEMVAIGDFIPRAINDAGVVVGEKPIPYAPGMSRYWAVIWNPDTSNAQTGTLTNLGVGTNSSSAEWINNQGTVVCRIDGTWQLYYPLSQLWQTLHGIEWLSGFNNLGQISCRSSAFDNRVAIWSPGPNGGIEILPSTPRGYARVPGDLNDSGQVIARYYDENTRTYYPYVWMPKTGTWTGLVQGYTYPVNEIGINNYGQILYYAHPTPSTRELVLWTPTTANNDTGAYASIGWPADAPEADAILISRVGFNDHGYVAFTVYGSSSNNDTSFAWIPDVPNGTTGTFINLGQLDNKTQVVCAAINNHIQIVGYTRVQPYVAWMWTPVAGGGGVDNLSGSTGNDYIAGGDDNDSLSGGSGDDVLHGGDGSDTVDGGQGDDRLVGGAGDDIMDGGQGNDILYGGTGNDLLDTGLGDSQGADYIDGGPGNDRIHGGQGNDTLIGGQGDDIIDAQSGNDDVNPGTGFDTVQCGPGDDTLRISTGDVPAGRTEMLDGGEGSNDKLILTGIPAANVSTTPLGLQITDPSTGGTYLVMNVETVVHQ